MNTKVVVLGASGATGRLLVVKLLSKGIHVTAIVRNAQAFKTQLVKQVSCIDDLFIKLTIVEASISTIAHHDLSQHIIDCDAVLSCLGHNLTFSGMFGKPRRLVKDAVEKVSQITQSQPNEKRIKFILMNTTGNTNLDIPERPPLSQKIVVTALRYLLPPHADNEDAANYLRLDIGQNNQHIEWVVVRPDALIDQEQASPLDVFSSPTRNPIFDAGSTSRINVAHFMAELVVNDKLWTQWKGQMPVIYNQSKQE